MSDTSFRNDYLKDASSRIEVIRETLSGLLFANPEEQTAGLQTVMRETHAVKSGAGFYSLSSVEKHAHRLEDMASLYLKSGSPADDFSDMIKELSLLSASFYAPGTETGQIQKTPVAGFDLDKGLVGAWRRGERFYRLECRIDNEEPMPFARAFLLQSHIESRFTLHRSIPALNGDDIPKEGGREFRNILFLLSTNLEADEILKAVNRDRVVSSDIILMDFSEARDLVAGGETEESLSSEEETSGNRIPVAESTIDELKSLARELRSRIDGIRLGINTPRDLGILADRMEITLEEVRSVRAVRLFSEFVPWAKKLAADKGKILHMEINGGQFYLSRSFGPVLQDIVRQLVRNTVAHGLETPDERLDAGKGGTGLAVLTLSRDKGIVKIVFHDDGRGFDESLLADGESLGDKLVRSGYSTAEETDLVAGRGVGLDFVSRAVSGTLGGTLNFENSPGQGMTITVTFPDREYLFSLFLFRYRNEVYGLPGKNIEDFFPIDRKQLKINRKTGVYYGLYQDRYYPLYSLNAPCRDQNAIGKCSSLIVIRHWGRRVLLPADELVLKEDFPEGEIVIGEPVMPHIYRVEPRPGLPGFLYLSPALAG